MALSIQLPANAPGEAQVGPRACPPSISVVEQDEALSPWFRLNTSQVLGISVI